VTVPRIAPMSASTGDLPRDDERWAFEPKWDGMRVLVEVDGGTVTARSRTDREVTESFPELEGVRAVAPTAVLDGEIVSLDGTGRPSFNRLQQRFGVTGRLEVAVRAREVPAFYVIFDVLHLGGIDSWTLPFHQRRELLEELVEDGPTWRLTPSGVGHGQAWLDGAREQGLEGIMAKRLDRPYEPGRRSEAWRKIKIRHEQEFAVCGWTPGSGRRENVLGSLVLGCCEAGSWRWVGNVGTGLTDADLVWWRDRLAATASSECPFEPRPSHPALRHAHWVEPTEVVQVAYTEWTGDRRLRQPSLLGRRPDVDVGTVRCEE